MTKLAREGEEKDMSDTKSVQERFVRVNHNEMPSGSSLKGGTINCSYKTIVAAFGEPDDSDGYKVSSEWSIKDTVTGDFFCLYDYKETNLYYSKNPTVLEFRAKDSYDWHICCNRNVDVTALEVFLSAHKGQATTINTNPAKVVYKYDIDLTTANTYIELPDGAKILSVHGNMLWALVDTSNPKIKRRIVSIATGVPIDNNELVWNWKYIGSEGLGGRVYHLFDCGNASS
jgi:hypothetical protein